MRALTLCDGSIRLQPTNQPNSKYGWNDDQFMFGLSIIHSINLSVATG